MLRAKIERHFMTTQILANVLNLKQTPLIFDKYVNSINTRQHVITKQTLDEAFRFYQLKSEKTFYRQCLALMDEIKHNPELKNAALLLKYIAYYSDGEDFLDMENWKASPARTDLSALILLSGVRLHQKALKGLDKEQYQHQIKGIHDTFMRGLKLYKINGISYNSLAWGIRFVRGRLMKFGRLQFEYSLYEDPFVIVKDKKGDLKACKISQANKISSKDILLSPKNVCINIHIDRSERLFPHLVETSFKRAKKELLLYFPSLKGKRLIYRCHSWLLSPQMKQFLSDDRHIMNFQNRFFILPSVLEDTGDDFFRFLFNTQKSTPGFSLETLPDDTSLRKKVKEYFLAGGVVQEGRGLIFEDIE